MNLQELRESILDRIAPFLALLVLGGTLAFTTKNFLSTDNLLNISLQTAVIAIIAIGETFVIIAAGIDLAVGSVVALSGVVACMAMTHHLAVPLAVLIGVAMGGFCGLFNGAITTKFRMPPFIVTLGMMGIGRGGALVLTDGTPIYDLPESFDWLGKARLAGVPVPALLMVVIAIAASILLKYTRFGRQVYAIGGNAEAARLSGIPTARNLTVVFMLCGALSGFAGVMHASRIGIGSPTEGQMYELDAIAAAVIGGASLFGGEGTVLGTVLGAFLMSILRNGCNLLGLKVYWQQVTIGAIIILAVMYDHLRRRKARTVST